MLHTTLFFWAGDGYAEAKHLAQQEKTGKRRAFTRDATVFAGDAEQCHRVVVLPSVKPTDVDRIVRAFKRSPVQIEKMSGNGVAAIVPPERKAKGNALPLIDKLRRLPTRQLRDAVRERGIDLPVDADRTTMIGAILEKENPT